MRRPHYSEKTATLRLCTLHRNLKSNHVVKSRLHPLQPSPPTSDWGRGDFGSLSPLATAPPLLAGSQARQLLYLLRMSSLGAAAPRPSSSAFIHIHPPILGFPRCFLQEAFPDYLQPRADPPSYKISSPQVPPPPAKHLCVLKSPVIRRLTHLFSAHLATKVLHSAQHTVGPQQLFCHTLCRAPSHSVFVTDLGGWYNCLHLIHEKTEAQRGKVIVQGRFRTQLFPKVTS